MISLEIRKRIQEVKKLMSEDNSESVATENEEAPKTKGAKKVSKKKGGKVKKGAKPVKAAKKAAKKESAEGMVSLSDLAEEVGITPAAARRKLRTAEVDRGEGRWKWSEGSNALKAARKALSTSE